MVLAEEHLLFYSGQAYAVRFPIIFHDFPGPVLTNVLHEVGIYSARSVRHPQRSFSLFI